MGFECLDGLLQLFCFEIKLKKRRCRRMKKGDLQLVIIFLVLILLSVTIVKYFREKWHTSKYLNILVYEHDTIS